MYFLVSYYVNGDTTSRVNIIEASITRELLNIAVLNNYDSVV